MWMSPSWEIYERWCFVKAAGMLRDRLPDFLWTRERNNVWVGKVPECLVRLELQATFLGGPGPQRWSVSRQREPDLLLVIERAGEERFLVLDAKYRTSRANVLEAMASAHVYRDSLRIGERRADRALLLVPAGGGADWLEKAEFQRKQGVGVCVLNPEPEKQLPEAVAEFLEWAKAGI